eukprot:4190939-Amphidinium_carterae.1
MDADGAQPGGLLRTSWARMATQPCKYVVLVAVARDGGEREAARQPHQCARLRWAASACRPGLIWTWAHATRHVAIWTTMTKAIGALLGIGNARVVLNGATVLRWTHWNCSPFQ